MSRALIQTAHARRLEKDKGAGERERPPGTSAGHQGTGAGRLRLASGAKMPARPNTAVSVKGTDILHLPNEWALDGAKDLDEKDFLLGVVKQNGDYLQYASARMRRDPDVVLAAVANKGYAMKYAGPELVEDPAWMMKVVQECSRTYKYAGIKAYEFSPLEYAQSNIRKSKAIVMEAAVRQPFSMCFADADLRDDTEFCMEILKKNGLAMEYMSKRLKRNMMLVEIAINQNPNSLVYAHIDVRSDPGIQKKVKELLEGKGRGRRRPA